MNDNKDFLAKEPVGKLLLKLALPTVTAQIINMLYNIIDRIYIGTFLKTALWPYRSRCLHAPYYDRVRIRCSGWKRRRSQSLDLYGTER